MNEPESSFDELSEEDFSDLVLQGQSGNEHARSKVLEAFRIYLLVVANRSISTELQAKVSAADLVQDSLIEAQADFDQCKATDREQVKHWLRRILLNNLINQVRDWKRQKRDIDRERSLDPEIPIIDEEIETPSTFAMRNESQSQLTTAIQNLPDVYRVVIELGLEDLSYAEIGEKIGRSSEASRKLWVRAVEKLSAMLLPK